VQLIISTSHVFPAFLFLSRFTFLKTFERFSVYVSDGVLQKSGQQEFFWDSVYIVVERRRYYDDVCWTKEGTSYSRHLLLWLHPVGVWCTNLLTVDWVGLCRSSFSLL